jgi:hypothetical protein
MKLPSPLFHNLHLNCPATYDIPPIFLIVIVSLSQRLYISRDNIQEIPTTKPHNANEREKGACLAQTLVANKLFH